MSRVLAGFNDGRADEDAGTGEPTLAGLRIARERGWTAPEGPDTEPDRRGETITGEPGSSAERQPTTPSDTQVGKDKKPGEDAK
jgi:NADH-quinone oxidoreductase subunit E